MSAAGPSGNDESDMFRLFQEWMATRELSDGGSTADAGAKIPNAKADGTPSPAKMHPYHEDSDSNISASQGSTDENPKFNITEPGNKQDDDTDSDQTVESTENVPTNSKPADERDTKSERVGKTGRYSIDDYFSKGSNPAKTKLRHIMRKISIESGIYGIMTYRDAKPEAKHHVFKRVIQGCPELEGHEARIDGVLKNMLIQAKHYRTKKELKESLASNKGKASSKPGSTSQTTKTSPSKPSGSSVTKKTISCSSTNRSRGKLPLKPKPGAGKRIVHSPKTKSTLRTKSKYEKDISACTKANKAVLTEVIKGQETLSILQSLKPGDPVDIKHDGSTIGKGVFISKPDDIYSKLAFKEMIMTGDSVINLPKAVPEDVSSGRKKKLYFAELKPDDIFMWKLEKIRKVTRERKPVDRLICKQ